MLALTDRQRIELAIPAHLFYVLVSTPGAFAPKDPALNARAEGDIAGLRVILKTACAEPFADLVPQKHQALLRRLQRILQPVTTEWRDQSALSVMLMIWYFLQDLIEREVLILWEGSAMDRATRQLLPMFAHGFERQHQDADAQGQAHRLLARLRSEGLYG